MMQLLPFIKLFKRQWLMMCLGLLLTVITLMAGIGLLSLSGWFLSATAVAGLTVATAQAFNYFTPAGGVRFLSIVRTASRYGERLATHQATFKLLTQLRRWLWCRLIPLSSGDLQALRSSDLLNRLIADIDSLDHLYLRLITPITATLLMIFVLYLSVSLLDANLAIILSCLLLALLLLLPIIFYVLGHKPGIDQLEATRQLRVLIIDYLQGHAELTLFGAIKRYRTQLEQAQSQLFTSQARMAKVTALSQAAVVLGHGLVVVILFYIAFNGIGDSTSPSPLLALVVFMTLATVEMLMPLAGVFQHLSTCVLAAQRINEVIDKQPSITFRDNDQHRITDGAINIDKLNFGYNAKQPILQSIDLTIKAGEKVALLGKTGCGKSSLLALITREWQPQNGKIELDGRPIEHYSERTLREAMTVVSQRIYLFSGTLRENLVLAQLAPQADAPQVTKQQNDALLVEVLHKVGLGQLVQNPQSLDTLIGEGGRQLSGGEQRRIGVARALLRDAPLLLLDEPTEGLDQRTEKEILTLLFEFARDKTMLMISHRLTSMAMMDRIYIMEDGKITAAGSHQQLQQNNGYYASLYQ